MLATFGVAVAFLLLVMMLWMHRLYDTYEIMAQGDGYDLCQYAWPRAISHVHVSTRPTFSNIDFICFLKAAI